LTDHFSSDELVFNAYTKLVAGMLGSSGITQPVGIPKGCLELVFNDPRETEKLNRYLEIRKRGDRREGKF
jgi:hypothetical protein